jgi:hypothetical protein
MKAFWNFCSNFLAPVGVFIAVLPQTSVPVDSGAAVAVLVGFMIIKLMLQHVFFEPRRALFASVNRESEFLFYTMLIYTMVGMGTIQLFMLVNK